MTGREQRESTGRVLCLDFGTSSAKGGIIDRDGRLVAFAREPLLSNDPGELESWEAGRWIEALRRIVGRLTEGQGGRITAVAMSGNGPTVVPVDSMGIPTGPALLWIDHRSEPIAGAMSYFLPKIAWLRRNQPETFRRTATFLPFPEYLNHVLTGEPAGIVPSDEFAPYFWSPEELDRYGFDRAAFPPLVKVGSLLGRVTRVGNAASGIPERCPVYASGSDFFASLLGTGAVRVGRTCDRAGTSEGINYCHDRPVPGERLRCLPHVIPGRYNVAGILASTGRLFEWFRRISGQSSKPYELMLGEIEAVGHRPGGPRFFPSSRAAGAWEFSHASFTGLEPEHGPAELGRAIVEAIGFGVRSLIEALEAHGCPVEELRMCGGQARNPTWCQMKADIVGASIVVPEVVDAELLGNACAAFLGTGEFGSLEEASEALVRVSAAYEPRPDEHRRFDERYREYCALSPNPSSTGRAT